MSQEIGDVFPRNGKDFPKFWDVLISGRQIHAALLHNGEMKVLLVEDDGAIADAILDSLEAVSWEVRLEKTGQGGIAALTDANWDIVLLDLGLPDMDGIEVTRVVRQHHRIPIIVISARGEEADRVLALELGADDYLVKPFGMRELLARIRAVYRRSGVEESEQESGLLTVGPLKISLRERTAALDGISISLTPKEFDVLAYLAAEPGTAHRRETILADVWDMNWYGSTKTLDAHIASLRKKLGDPNWISSVRGVGFRLQEPQ